MVNKKIITLCVIFFSLFASFLEGATPKISSVVSDANSLSLTFLSPPPKISPPTVLTDGQQWHYRYVFDVEGDLSGAHPIASIGGVGEVKIAQNTPTMTRIVFGHHSPLTIRTETKNSTLRWNIERSALPVKSEISIAKPHELSQTRKADILPSLSVNKQLPRFEPILSAPREHKKDRLIVIDIGHGGKDSGAVGYSGLKEKDIVLEVGNKIAKRLRNIGYRVSMSRDSDVFVELPDRTKMANDKNGDLFISIHANAVAHNITAKGIETYFLSPARSDRAKRVALKENAADVRMMDDGALSTFLNVLNKEKIVASHKLAIDVHGMLLKNLRSRYDDIRDNGVREAPFWVLVGAQMPAILVELGYITNPTEAQRMDNPLYQDLLAEGIVSGIEGYLKNN